MVGVKNLIIAALLCTPVFSAMSEDLKTVNDLDYLQSQRAYYEGLAAMKKAKAEADSQGASISSNYSTPVNQGQGVPQQNMSVTLPQVTKISGGISGMKANIRSPDGSESSFKTGDVLPGGLKITLITLSGVAVEDVSTGKKYNLN